MRIKCPNCESCRMHRSKTKGLVETLFLAVILVRPFRCEEFDLRFFRWSYSEKPGPDRAVTTS